ncbi:hypothetical protein EV356DRAFT_457908, partial [Viridothelium virens]
NNIREGEEAKVKKEEGKSVLELQNAYITQIGINNYSILINIIKYLSKRLIKVFWLLSK